MEGTIYEKNFDRKVDKNADNRQRTTTNIKEREASLEATGGIPRNIHEQRSSSPPFGPLRYYSLPLGNIHHSLILVGSHSVAKGTLFHQKTTIKWEQNWEQNHSTPIDSIGQKWTKIALLSLDTPTHPPASSAKKAPSEVQILLPRPGLRQEALL